MAILFYLAQKGGKYMLLLRKMLAILGIIMAMGGVACIVMDIQRNFGKKERVVLETIESSNNGHHIKMEVTGVKRSLWIH